MLASVGRAVVRCLMLAMVLLVVSPVGAAAGSRHRWKVSTASPSVRTHRTDEISSLRTRTSRTYEGQDGSHELELGRESINFRDARGRWRVIDNTLVVDGAV